VRNDLRQDLLHLGLLRTYPLRGHQVVFAEMISPTLILSLFQLALLATGWFSVPPDVRASVGGGWVRAMALVIPFAVVSLNALNVAIQNGLAILFPSWVRLGPDSGGIEAIGQNILIMVGSMLALVIALIPPMIAAGIVRTISVDSMGRGALALAAAIGTVALDFEIAGLVALLGMMFDKLDPGALT
jgi:ABC-2 type transport system permease protein